MGFAACLVYIKIVFPYGPPDTFTESGGSLWLRAGGTPAETIGSEKTSRAQTTKTKICINYRCVTKV